MPMESMKIVQVLMRQARRMLLLAIMSPCSLVIAQQQPQPAKPVTDLHDLELGMPRDYVLAGLAVHYKLTEPSKPSDPAKGVDLWQAVSGDRYAGDVCFKDGKLAYATVNLYYTEGNGGAHELVDKLFATLFDNSGQSTIREGPLGMMTRSRTAMIRLESVEDAGSGNFRKQSLHFQMIQGAGDSGTRQFILSVMTGEPGSRIVEFDESIIKEWQDQTGRMRKEH